MILEGERGKAGHIKRCNLRAVENSENVPFSERTEMVSMDDHREGMEELLAGWAEPYVGQEGE